MPPEESAGILFLPEALKWEPSGRKEDDDDFLKALMASMTEAIEDPSSASARSPYIVYTPAAMPTPIVWRVDDDPWRAVMENF